MDINLQTINNGDTGAQASAKIIGNDNALKSAVNYVDGNLEAVSGPSKNLFNPFDPDILRGVYIAGDGGGAGTPTANSTYSITGYIPILAGQTLISNKPLITTAIGINLYDEDRVFLSVTNSTNQITASVDGFARFTLPIADGADIGASDAQIELGTVSTPYVPPRLIRSAALDAKAQNVFDAFVDRAIYSNLTVVLGNTSAFPLGASDIDGWGATYNKIGASFNGIRIPAGAGRGFASGPSAWKYAQVHIKNAEADTDYIAKSLLVDIEGLAVLPDLVYALYTPDLNTPDLNTPITLNDASFSGSTYWVDITYYNKDMGIAYGGCTEGAMSNYVAGSSRYTTNSGASWAPFSGFPSIAFALVMLSDVEVALHLKEIDDVEAQIAALQQDSVEIILPDNIDATVGDTLQLFWRGIIKAVNPYAYDIVVNCAKGAWFRRYFGYTPQIGDVGTTPFNVKVKNNKGTVLATKTVTLTTKDAVAAPVSLKKALSLGDSLTNARIWPSEAYRRLTGTGGSPAGKAFGNISFVGRKKAGVVGVEGNGGWSWSDYLGVGRKAITFTVSGVTTQPTVESQYMDSNGKYYTMWWDYSSTSLKFLVDDMVSTPPASGALTKVNGTGDATINYSARVQSSGNPFWNDGTNALDFTAYVNKWCGGTIDVVYCLLTWNAQYGNRTDFSAFTSYAQTLFDHMKAQFPAIKIKLMGVQVSDLYGGVRVDGPPTENYYTDTYGLVVTALNMNKAYQTFAAANSSFVEFIDVSMQVDSEYNMGELLVPVNTRNSAHTENIGTNDVHPSTEGYYQIADAVYRNFIANFCQ